MTQAGLDRFQSFAVWVGRPIRCFQKQNPAVGLDPLGPRLVLRQRLVLGPVPFFPPQFGCPATWLSWVGPGLKFHLVIAFIFVFNRPQPFAQIVGSRPANSNLPVDNYAKKPVKN